MLALWNETGDENLRRLAEGRQPRGMSEIRTVRDWIQAVSSCLMATYALESPSLFRYWEPLWPKWISDFQYLS